MKADPESKSATGGRSPGQKKRLIRAFTLYGPQTSSSSSIPLELVREVESQAPPRPAGSDFAFNQVPRGFLNMVEFEKHWFSK